MNAVATALAHLDDATLTVVLLVAKLTLVLAAAWGLHFGLRQVNPRWRVFLWRSAATATVVVLCLHVGAPLFQWAVLPAQTLAVGTRPRNVDQAAAAEPPAPGDRLQPPAAQDWHTERNGGHVASDFAARPEGDKSQRTADEEQASSYEATRPVPRQTSVAAAAPAASADAAPLEPTDAAHSWPLPSGLLLAWGAGCALAAIRLLVGTLGVRRLLGSSVPVPSWIADEATAAAARLSCRRTFTLRATDELSSPCIVGIARPVVLIPSRQCEADYRDELPAILAHEIAHLTGHDLPWNALLHALQVSLWFHPLLWRARAVHAAACDRVADAVAAQDVGDVTGYGQTLAALALRTAIPPRTVGLAMARVSDVRDRIESLHRKLFSARLGRGRVAAALATSCVAVVLLGGLAMTRSTAQATPPPPPSAAPETKSAAEKAPAVAAAETSDQKAASDKVRSTVKNALAAALGAEPAAPAGQLVIQVTADAGGAPLADAQFHFNGRMGGKRFDRKLSTDAEGKAILKYPADKAVDNLWMTCVKQGFVPQHYTWRSENKPIEMDQHLELRLVPGVTIGGRVQDEEGRPIADAKVDLDMPVTWPKLANHIFTAASVKTDADGRWSWSGAPAGVAQVGMSIAHPDYLAARTAASEATEQVVVLKRGLQVAGRVTGKDGQPVADAQVQLGFDRFGSDDPQTKTDADGRFVLKKCKPGKSLVTVQKDEYSPQFRELTVGETNEEMNFQLEPGHLLRVRIIDGEGNPVPKAIFVTDTWRGYRSLNLRSNTDAEGRVTWRGAPADVMLCDVLASGYMAQRRVPLTASDEEQTITVYRPLVISGRVTDAATGEPLAKFSVKQGQKLRGGNDQIFWSRDESVAYTDGAYRYKFDEPTEGYVLQVEADGYRPATTRLFKPTEGEQTFDVQLQPGSGPKGVVLLADGQPAKNAEVGLATASKRAFLRLGQFDRSQNQTTIVKTDDQGHFQFPAMDEKPPFAFIVVHEGGFSQSVDATGDKDQRIELTPWGKIEGRVLVGTQPDAGQSVSFQPPGLGGGGLFVFSYGYEIKTDAQGRFHFDRAIPGRGNVSRVVVTEFLRSQQHAPCWNTPIEVRSNETTSVTIGGSGRPVAGQVVLDRQPGFSLDWTTNEPATIQPWDKETGRIRSDNGVWARYMANIDRSGRFVVPDVPAGSYRLTIPINNPPRVNACGAGDAIGRGEFDFDVPEMPGGRSDEPLELGTVTARLFDTVDPGEVAPDFAAERLDGGMLRLRDFKGKLVLVDFWATWCGPCLAEMPALAEIHKQHGTDPRFALVSLACDNKIDAPREYLQDKGYDWLQAHIAGTNSRVAKDFTVRSLPATFLIGPDGRVLAKDLRGAELKQAVAAALADDKLFQASAGSGLRERFTLTRYEPTALAAAARAATPALVVLDDSDPNFDKSAPRHDTLRALDAAGRELWSQTGFNSSETVGAVHYLAADRQRGRIYVSENAGDRLTAFALDGQKLWQISGAPAGAIAVDDKTGDIWAASGGSIAEGELVVFDTAGNERVTLPYRAVDLAFDARTDGFWLVGDRIQKIDRHHQVIVQIPIHGAADGGWCCASVAVSPPDGSAWIVERDHPDVPHSKNRLWHLQADGTIRHKLALGDYDPFVVACDPATGDAWLGSFQAGIRRVTVAGEIGAPLDIKLQNMAVAEGGAAIWGAMKNELFKLNRDAEVLGTFKLARPSNQLWLLGF